MSTRFSVPNVGAPFYDEASHGCTLQITGRRKGHLRNLPIYTYGGFSFASWLEDYRGPLAHNFLFCAVRTVRTDGPYGAEQKVVCRGSFVLFQPGSKRETAKYSQKVGSFLTIDAFREIGYLKVDYNLKSW